MSVAGWPPVVCAVVAAVACGQVSDDSNSTGSGASSGDAGHSIPDASTGGTGGTLIVNEGGNSPKQCSWPVSADAGDAAPSWAQAVCDGTADNDVACPAEPPTAGGPCDQPSLACAYGGGEWFSGWTCSTSGTWASQVRNCGCTPPEPGPTRVELEPALCDGATEVSCAAGAYYTNAERLELTLASIGACCGAPNESMLTVFFENGCATAVESSRTGSSAAAAVQCVASVFAGRRVACAIGQSCAVALYSTLL